MDAFPSAVISGSPHLRVTSVELHSDGIHVEAVAETAAVASRFVVDLQIACTADIDGELRTCLGKGVR